MNSESKKFKAVILCIDSPGGDALAFNLIWREIKLLAATKPIVASMSDGAASGGYYMVMGITAIVAESLTLTSSIGVVIPKFNLEKLYKKLVSIKRSYQGGRLLRLMLLNKDHSDLMKQKCSVNQPIMLIDNSIIKSPFQDQYLFIRWRRLHRVKCGLVVMLLLMA